MELFLHERLFADSIENREASQGRPWAIQGALLNIQHWDEYMIFGEVNFDWCPFWVQFHGLPHAALDGENAIKLGDAVGRTVLYESPKLQDRLSRTFIRARVLIRVHEPLVKGFWVPRPNRDPIWVTVRYERLQNYCYDCGRIGHESRNCKFLADATETEVKDFQPGSGLGTAHVKVIEDAMVIHDTNWDEAAMYRRQPPPAASHAQGHRRIDDVDRIGKRCVQGEESGRKLMRNKEGINGTLRIKEVSTEQIQKEIESKLPSEIREPSPINLQPQFQVVESGSYVLNQEVSPNGATRLNASFNDQIQRKAEIIDLPSIKELNPEKPPIKLPIQPDSALFLNSPIEVINFTNPSPRTTQVQHRQSSRISINQTETYRVEFPDEEHDDHTTLIPFLSLSPIAAVTSGLNRISLKRSPEPLSDEESPNPMKKRLTSINQEPDAHVGNTYVINPGGTQGMNVHKLKKFIRGKRGPQKINKNGPMLTSSSNPMSTLEDWKDNGKNLSSPISDPLINADGCHQAAIGPRQLDKALESIEAKIDDTVNESLLRPVTREEIRLAVFELGGSKALGSDGFQASVDPHAVILRANQAMRAYCNAHAPPTTEAAPDKALMTPTFWDSSFTQIIMFKSQNKGKQVQESSDVHTASKIEELKTEIGPLSGRSLKYCTDGCLKGYLEVNNWNVKKAKKMLGHTLEWRSTYKPEEIRWHEVAKEGERGIIYRANFHDRQGRTVLIFRTGIPIQKITSIETLIRFDVHLLENAVLNFKQGQDQMAWLIDFTGWSLTNMSIRLAREFLNILQNHYPDRVAIAFLYNPPRAFETFLKIIKYVLDNKTLEKAKFVYPKEKESIDLMKSYFDEENLPIEFGGKATLKYNHEEYSRLMTQDDLKSAAFWGADDSQSSHVGAGRSSA
ncbi:hypothetical protein K1719_015616 [Acacia pycnantha]|nr:hypothetical protein K1719_015616 [Acacia pycnantha]